MTEVFRRPILPVAVFLNIFAWALSTVSLPFYVQGLGGADAPWTLRWVGWILGVTPLLAVGTTPVWMRLTRAVNPRAAFVLSNGLQGLPLAALAFAQTVPQVFAMRALLGLGGPSNTFAFLIAGRSGRDGTPREVAAMQSAINLALILGPLAGSVAAARWGYATTFVMSAALLWGCAILVRLAEPPSPPALARPAPAERSTGSVMAVCLLVLVGYSQVFFLNAIFPNVLPIVGVPADRMMPVTGWILFATGVVLTIGPLAGPVLSERFGEVRVVVGCVTASSLLLTVIGLAPDLPMFTGLWLLHVLAISPVFSVVTARVSVWTSGQALGLVNVFRVLATFFAPVAATTLLSWSSAPAVFVALGAWGCVSLLVVHPSWRRICAGPRLPADGAASR